MNTRYLTASILLACLSLLGPQALANQANQASQPAPINATKLAQDGGKVNLNTASVSELAALNGIGEKKAEAIVAFREQQGKFSSVEQLAEVSGIGPAILAANRDMIIAE